MIRRCIALFALFLSGCTDLEKLPPTAGPMLVLSPSQNYGGFPLSVSFTVEAIPSRGSIKYLKIDYGDGTVEDIKDKLKDNKAVLSRTYEKLGVFHVRLYGMDDSGSSETSTTVITNDPPKIDMLSAYKDEDFLEPTSDFVPGDTVYVRAMCSDMNGISTVLFIWGDGEYAYAEKCESSHRYSSVGDYTITVVVYDANRFAPYPLSAVSTIKVSIYEGAGSAENLKPFISLNYEYVRDGIVTSEGVNGVVSMELGVLVGVADLDSDVRRVFIDWGDGRADSLVVEKAIAKSGRRYIFRASHKYDKEGEFFIKVIAYDSLGKMMSESFGPIRVFGRSPALYVEATDANNMSVEDKTFPSPMTLRIKTVSFDVASSYYVFVLINHNQDISNRKEMFVRKLKDARYLEVVEEQMRLASSGKYELVVYATPDPVLDDCHYCADGASYLNESLWSSCRTRSTNSLSECEILAGKLKNAQVKAERVFSFFMR